VNRPLEVLRGAVSPIRGRLTTVAGQSERTILLGTVLLASAVSVVTSFVLARYYSVDMISSLLVFVPVDCYVGLPMQVGRHCFSDYSITVHIGMAPNPWELLYLPPDFKPIHFNYPAAGMVPHLIFGFLGKWLGAPRVGLFGYLLVLTIAVFTPAVWAARGARGLERVVVFMACGVVAIPAWMVIDRGNSVGFLAPIGLVFLVALCRRRWGLVTIMVVLAALVKPQFAVLAVALFATRQWRSGGISVAGAVVCNLAAYALWPRDFPQTITQSIHNLVGYGGGETRAAAVATSNVSFVKALFMIPDGIKARETGGTIPDDFLAGPRSLSGYAILVLVVVLVLALGRRIPPVMVGIVLLATASLFAPLTNPYYLVFVLPVAALVARDPDGPPGTGIFDRPEAVGGRRRAVGLCVSLAAALCIAQIALPSPPQQVGDIVGGRMGFDARTVVVTSTVSLAPLLWLVACGVILVSYARRPAAAPRSDQGLAGEVPPDTAVSTSGTSEPITEFSPQRPV
jgi:hypothetical protein